MSQRILVYKSLVSESRLIRFAIALAGIAGVEGMRFGQPFFASFIFSVATLALGGSVSRYRTWEGGRIVPGFSKAQAAACIQITILIWAVLIVSGIGSSAPLMFSAGLSLPLLAVGLCVGAGEFLLFYFTCAVITLGSIFFYKPTASGPSSEIWSRFSPHVLELVGLLLLPVGCALLLRFWTLATGSSSVRGAFDAKRWEVSDDSNQAAVCDSESVHPVPRSRSARIRELIEPTQVWNWQGVIWSVALAAVVLVGLIYTRGKETTTLTFQLMAALGVVAAPASIFVTRVAESFERLWVLGESATRIATLRRKLVVTAWHCLAFFVIVVVALAIQSSTNKIAYAAMVTIMLLAFGVGALLLLVTTRMYRIWKEHSNAMALISIGLLLTAVLITYFVTNGSTELFNSFVERTGIIPCLAAALLFAVATWSVCILDGDRAMANDSTLLQ